MVSYLYSAHVEVVPFTQNAFLLVWDAVDKVRCCCDVVVYICAGPSEMLVTAPVIAARCMAANPVNTPGRFDTLRTSLGKKDLRKKERMICKMNKEMLKLQKNFKEFHHTIRKKLSCKRVSFVNVQSSLQYLPCFKNTADLQCVLDHNTAIGKAKNMHDLFSAVLAYSSWYNYQLIALLAINFGGKGAKSIVQSYEARLQDHLLRPVPHCPPFWPATDGDALPNQEIPEGFTKMEVVVKRSYETCTLRDINILKNALSELLQLHQEAMILGSIQPGEEEQCHMTWMVPSVAMQHTINIAITRMSQLGASQIQQLRIGSTTIVTAPRPGQSAVSNMLWDLLIVQHY